MKKTLLAGLFSVGLLSAASTSAASNWSIHFNAGISQYDEDDGIMLDDDSDTAFSAGLAYELNDSLSIEAAYNDFGAAVVRGIDLDFSSISLALIGKQPLSEKFALTGKIGVERLEGESSFNIDTTFFSANFSIEEEETEAFAGIGLDYAFNPSITLRSNLDFHDSGDIIVFSSGLKYNF